MAKSKTTTGALPPIGVNGTYLPEGGGDSSNTKKKKKSKKK